jgi:hypothetical protein
MKRRPSHPQPGRLFARFAAVSVTSILAATLGVGLAFAPGCNSYREAPLQRSTAVPAQIGSFSQEQMEAAIGVALAKHGWRVVDKVPGLFTVELSERVHRVRIQIVYGAPGIVINYVESENLRYARNADGTETIHRKYATWVKNLSQDIQLALATSQAQAASPPS